MTAKAYLLLQVPSENLSVRAVGYSARWRCDLTSELPTSNVFDGDVALTLDTGKQWSRTGGVWIEDLVDPAVWGGVVGTLSDQTDLQTVLDTKGTSNFSGAYADLSGKPTLGTAAATASTDYATAAQGATANSALQPAGNGSALTGLTKAQVGLANADNTSDAAKPVSTAQQSAFDLKANLASPTFTGTVGGVTATMVGLGSVNNTSDADKPISTATQTALDAKQATLVSATNIKTINGSTVLGSGDLVVSGSTNIKQTEIDFGTTPVSEASFIITDADVSAGSQLIGSIAYEAPTGKDLDELEMDALDVKLSPGVGQFTAYVVGLDGYVADKFKLSYLIG